MREIKFRAWDKIEKKMGTVGSWNGMTHGPDSKYNYLALKDGHYGGVNYSDAVLMQFTGLHDKNGKEIYEGDIVEVEGGTGVIVWDEHDLAWDLRGADMPITRSMEPKVIGNIYEHPKLLESAG